jgi:alkylated DNA repair dioxygenase AlkB
MATREIERPEGLTYEPELLTVEQERELVRAIELMTFQEVRMHGVVAKRTTIHFGWDYGYESWKIERSDPLPESLVPLRDSVAEVAKVAPDSLEEVLVTRYPPGAQIGWHRDAPMFGPVVYGVSLLAPCTMRFRKKEGEGWLTYALPLEPRSMYTLAGAARSQWQHTISPVKELRYSITFRTVKKKPE